MEEKIFEQKTFEGCLAMSLLFLINEKNRVRPTKQLELDCLRFAMDYTKNDFVIGHLEFIYKKFGIKFRRVVDNKMFFNYLKKNGFVDRFETEVEKINLKTIDRFLLKSSVALYIDSFLFYEDYHYPHFIVVVSKHNQNYKIFDPWDGKIKIVEPKKLSKAISSLRNHLRFCPQLLVLE